MQANLDKKSYQSKTYKNDQRIFILFLQLPFHDSKCTVLSSVGFWIFILKICDIIFGFAGRGLSCHPDQAYLGMKTGVFPGTPNRGFNVKGSKFNV